MHTPSALQDAFDRQVALCDLLESIADSLPDQIDRQQCLEVARAVVITTIRLHEVEDRHLFSQLLARGDTGRELLIEELRLERSADEYRAEEVQEELRLLGKGQSKLAPEALGYMLRGFFDSSRRHVRHCRELLRVIQGA